MKKIKLMLLAVLASVALTSVQAADQFRTDYTGLISGVGRTKVTTNNSVITVLGFMNSNFTASAQKLLPVPRDGKFGFWVNTGATNALTVTNSTATFEGVMFDSNGRTNVVDNWTFTIPITASGTSASDMVTNFPQNAAYMFTVAGVDAIRLRSITNVNAESIFITNFLQLRP